MRRISIDSGCKVTESDMLIRTMHHSDRDKLLRIWNDSAKYDPLTMALMQEKIQCDPDIDTNSCLVAEFDEKLVGFGIGVLRQRRFEMNAYVKMLAVELVMQKQGIGGALLARIEAELAARGVTSIRFLESAPNYLTPGIDVRYREGIRFVESFGYKHIGDAHNLVVDLRARDFSSPTNSGACEIDIRRATLGDAESLCEFLRDNSWQGWEAEVMTALDNVPPTLYLAFSDENIFGFSAYDSNNKDTGWFGPLGVAENERHTGVGCALLRQCLRDIQAQGHEMAIIPWVDAIAFYEKCVGAKLSRSFARYEKKVTI